MAVSPAYVQPNPMYYGQPMMVQPAAQQTTVVIQQAAQVPVNQSRDWSSGLCSCCEDMASCCAVYWCSPFYTCYLSSIMDEGCCMPCCVPYALAALRTKMRAENKIKGSILSDCCAVYWCTQCVMCQLKREHDHVTRG